MSAGEQPADPPGAAPAVSERLKRRWRPLLVVALAHAGLVVWLGVRTPPLPPPAGRGVSVGLFDGSVLGAAPAQAPETPEIAPPTLQPIDLVEQMTSEPLKATLPSDLEPLYVMPTLDGPAFDAEPVEVGEAAPAVAASAAGGGAGDACGLAADIVAELQADDQARAAVARIPAERRSGGNGVMLWNGGWADLGLGEPNPIRIAVVRRLRAATAACQQEQVSGPRLLAVSAGANPTFLAVGSGVWRWSELLKNDVGSGE